MVEKFQSNFVFGLQGNLYQEFIDRVAKPIIQQIIGTDDYEIVPQTYHLSFKDFDKKSRVNSIFPEFYYNFLGDIVKKNNKISFKTKVCISFDERLCNDVCPNTNRKIATIKIADVKLAYFIFFDVKDFFDFVYDNEIIEIQKENQHIETENIQTHQKAKIVQPKFEMTSHNQDDIVKIGYIHNLNHERRFSFIQINKDDNDGFPIFYQDFPEFEEFPIGTVVKATGKIHADRFYVKDYEIGETEDLDFQLMKLKGTLKCQYDKKFATIRTKIGTVFVPSYLIQDYEIDEIYDVECLAIENYDYEKDQEGWKAISISDINE